MDSVPGAPVPARPPQEGVGAPPPAGSSAGRRPVGAEVSAALSAQRCQHRPVSARVVSRPVRWTVAVHDGGGSLSPCQNRWWSGHRPRTPAYRSRFALPMMCHRSRWNRSSSNHHQNRRRNDVRSTWCARLRRRLPVSGSHRNGRHRNGRDPNGPRRSGQPPRRHLSGRVPNELDPGRPVRACAQRLQAPGRERLVVPPRRRAGSPGQRSVPAAGR